MRMAISGPLPLTIARHAEQVLDEMREDLEGAEMRETEFDG
jgi:hypothetical protein